MQFDSLVLLFAERNLWRLLVLVLVPGTWYLVPGTWYLVLVLVPGTWYLVLVLVILLGFPAGSCWASQQDTHL